MSVSREIPLAEQMTCCADVGQAYHLEIDKASSVRDVHIHGGHDIRGPQQDLAGSSIGERKRSHRDSPDFKGAALGGVHQHRYEVGVAPMYGPLMRSRTHSSLETTRGDIRG
jgi:hypothetical protein